MDNVISSCCEAFCINAKNMIICSQCNNVVGTVENDDDITIGIMYNSNPDMVKTINTTSSSIRIVKRLAKDRTCQLIDNKLCDKCKSKCRYYRHGDTVLYVCSNCRNVLEY